MKNESGVTEMKDKDYGLVSILYHSLKGAKSCIQFKAEAADDEELEQIFEEIYQEHTERSNRVRQRTGLQDFRHGSWRDQRQVRINSIIF
jgi:hypothetical protein